MISARTKEAVSYAAACGLIVVITLGCSAALIYMGLTFIRRWTG